MSTRKLGFAGRIAHYFINSKLTPLIMVFSILLGAFAVLQTPREEEPQIVVPMMDVFVEMPGSTAQEVEQRVTTPMEKLIWEIPGVEYIYSTTRPGLSMAIVRFKVGEKEEDSIIKLYNKLYSHFDLIPPGASKPLIKPRSIDDVPILALTFWSNRYDSYTLRRVASEVDREIKSIDDVSQTQVIGGERRQIRVLLDPARMAGYGVAPAALMGTTWTEPTSACRSESSRRRIEEYNVETGDFLRNADDVGRVVVGVSSGRPVYLRDVAEIRDGPEEPANYVLFGSRAAGATREILARASLLGESPAVTLTVSKRKGKNAVVVAERAIEKVQSLKGTLIPAGVRSDGHAELRRDGPGKIQRIIEAPAARHPVRNPAHRPGARLAVVDGGAGCRAGHPGADLVHLLHLWLHAEPRHPFRADLLHRHPGGRRHCGGGEHHPALPPPGK